MLVRLKDSDIFFNTYLLVYIFSFHILKVNFNKFYHITLTFTLEHHLDHFLFFVQEKYRQAYFSVPLIGYKH